MTALYGMSYGQVTAREAAKRAKEEGRKYDPGSESAGFAAFNAVLGLLCMGIGFPLSFVLPDFGDFLGMMGFFCLVILAPYWLVAYLLCRS